MSKVAGTEDNQLDLLCVGDVSEGDVDLSKGCPSLDNKRLYYETTSKKLMHFIVFLYMVFLTVIACSE